MGNHYMSRALLFSVGGDYERAAADASQLIKLGLDGLAQPKSSRTAVLRQVYNLWVETGYRMRAQYRFSMGDFENALADSNELIRLQPNNGAGSRPGANFIIGKSNSILRLPIWRKPCSSIQAIR